MNSTKTIDALKLDVDELNYLLIRKLYDKVRKAKIQLQQNKEVTVVFVT
jgi:hypothetical protein